MLIQIPQILNADQLHFARSKLDATNAWVDGRATAGHQGARVKNNLQIDERSSTAQELGDLILGALERNPLFISSVLPSVVYPPMFNRYEGGMQFGNHVDGAVRLMPGTGMKIRTDVSATLFLSPPEEYDGGELMIEAAYGSHAVKLPAGDMIVYPATCLHRGGAGARGGRAAAGGGARGGGRGGAGR